MNTMKKSGVINKLFGAVCLLAATFGLAVQVQAIAPVPQSITVTSTPANGTHYVYGESIIVRVSFANAITVVNGDPGVSPYVQLAMSPTDATSNRAGYLYEAGTDLFLEYVVQAGDFASPLSTSGALPLRVLGATVIQEAVPPNDVWNTGSNVPTAGANALSAAGAVVRTMSITPAAPVIQEGQSQLYTISRGGPRTTDLTVNLTSGTPAVGTVPASVTIPADAVTVQFSVTGLSVGNTTISADAYPLLAAVADETSLLTVNAGPQPTFSIVPPSLLYEGPTFNPDYDAATYPTTGSGTISLSRAPIAPITINLTSADPASLGFVGGVTAIQFLAGETNKTFSVEALDGNTAVAITGNDASGTYIPDGAAAVVSVLNVPPVLNNPPDPWTLANNSEGRTVTFSWGGNDVLADIPNLQAYFDFGDGNNSGWLAGASGNTTHIYNLPGTFGVTVTLRDQDGGEVTRVSQIIIDPATEILLTEVVRGDPAGIPPGYRGLGGLGQGSIDDTLVETIKVPVPGAETNVFTIKYSPTQPSVVLVANPNAFDIIADDGTTNTYDSFFHVWVGEGFLLPGATVPIANPTARLELNGQDRDIQGVFAREFDPLDNYADIDNDALPDQWEYLWWPDQALFETPNRAGNEDGDFLPRGSNADMAYPAAGGNYTPDGAGFGNVYEVRGLDIDLNAVNSDTNAAGVVLDEPRYDPDTREFFGTDPTSADTDGDGFSDGWEYYFWMNATIRGITGVRYNPAAPMTDGVIIPSADIATAFHPLVAGNPGQDLDGDGLSNIEEYALGTDPINWDSDGDTMADGWEVFRGLNPQGNDAGGNPDGDYMAALGWDASMNRNGFIPLLGAVHFNVYDSEEYDPRTGWSGTYTLRSRAAAALSPNTAAMLNLDEYAIMQFWITEGVVGAVTPNMWGRYSTNPQSNDTDGDGAPDGWEAYVYFDPSFNQAGILWDVDVEGLFLENEFAGVESSPNSGVRLTIGTETTAATSTNAAGQVITNSTTAVVVTEATPLANINEPWWNKFWPTDPNNADTDGDYVSDAAERASIEQLGVGPFLYEPPEGWSTAYIRGARAGGGLNPCSVDTDMDFIPDFWEIQYRYDRVVFMNPDGSTYFVNGMDGSIFDSRSGLTDLTGQEENYDYDGDGLENYQEYYVNAMWHFNYDKWASGLGVGAYPPADLMMGTPEHWDWAIAANYWERPIYEGMAPPMHTPYVFILPEFRPFPMLAYASADPSSWDTDGDGMDDHYEMFYALNPLWSETADLIAKGAPPLITDIRVQPWTAGAALSDPDQDGIPNWEEAIFPNRPLPANLNSSPSPHWVTDTSYEQSWVNLYYRPAGHSWFWFPGLPGDAVYPYPAVVALAPYPPSYVYSFANDEGYDTDNDNIPDRMEVTGANNVGLTDVTDFDSPRLRKALHVDGASAARTRFGASHEINQLRSWTVEIWVRPEEPVSPTGERQILIERPLQGVSTDPMPAPELVRRTFRVGLEPDGRPFAEYNNMGNELLSENIKATGWQLQTNIWYHIAASMDGDNNQFSLYVNGQLAARRSTALIPATGVIDANPPFVIPAPIVIGAADRNPNGLVQNPVPGLVTPPDLHSHFKGWVDEIRVWHGGRSQEEINSTLMHRFTLDDVLATMTNYAGRQAEADDLNPPDSGYQIYTNLPPVVLYHYAFDNLPDPKHDPIVPQNFELLNGRPNDGSYVGIPWWWQAPDRSRVYNDYRFVQWAENTTAHVPVVPMVNRFGNVVDYQFGVIHSSPFWTSPPWMTNTAPGAIFGFPNKTYPSQEAYYTSDTSLTEGGRRTTGLLPLWHAQADMDVPLWDNNTPGTSDYDSNGDGIADWWSVRHGFDPFGDSIADGDADGDGLSNYWEYRLGSDPNGIHSLDPTGMLTDAEYDSDGDGLPNIQEVQIYGTDPSLWDTDNGGLSDGQEVANHYNPLDSLSPLTNRVLNLSGAATDFVLMSTSTERFAITNWVIEAWVYPTAVAASEIIAREPRPGLFNYHLGMQADGRPAVFFDANTDLARQTLAADDPLPLNTWTHLRGGYDPSTYTLYIEVNGKRYETLTLAGRVPVTRLVATRQTRVGRGFIGMIDDVRIWSQAPLSTAVPALSHKRVGDSDILRYDYNNRAFMARGNEPGLVSWLRFDDGIITAANPNAARYAPWAFNVVEDFADVAGETPWLSQWRHHPRVQGAATVVDAPADTPSNVMFVEDRNADGLADWWQRQYWSDFDPYGSENGDWSPLSDPDGDGLNNMSEFLAGLDPHHETTGGTGLKDGLRDSDGDGLINLYEQNVSFTRVDLVDTDDDGLTDWEEAMGGRLVPGWVPTNAVPDAAGEWRKSDPLNPLSPIRHRSARFEGDGRIVYAHQDRHAQESWTVQAWIQADAGAAVGDAVVLRRRVENTDYDEWTVNYELGVHTDAGGVMYPYAQMVGVNPDTGVPFTNRVDGTQAGEVAPGVAPIDVGEWVHIAATYSETNETLNLYLDGDHVSSRSGVKLPHGIGLVEDRDFTGELTIGGGELVAGAVVKGFTGYIDDAIVLATAITPDPYANTTDAIDGVIGALRTFSTTSSPKPAPMTIAQALALPHVPGEMMVRFKHTVTPNDVNKTVAGRLGVTVLNQYRIAPVYKMGIPDGADLEQKLAELQADDDVLYAEPNFIFKTLAAPDDPRYTELWGMNNTGQTGGTPGAHISAEQAWEYARGAADLRVAVIDTGIDYNHPDIAANMWEGIGYDFANGDDDPMDDHSHGTHCAGTVAGVGNNGVGVSGVAWEAELVAIRVLGADGSGGTDSIVSGIQYAVENGAKVSNNSYGGYGFSQAMYDVIQAAGNAGHLFVAAAGNDNNDNDGEFQAYPASYDLPNIIAVAASDHNDARANFSNYGATSVDLAAPGVNILSTVPGGGYEQMSGTSMASPHVAGAAVVLMALNPGMTHAQIKDLILNTVDVLDPWNGVVLTSGRLNLGAAVGTPTDPGDPDEPAPLVGPALFNSFDDGGSTFDRGVTLADLTMGMDWEKDWLHAGTPTNVTISDVEFFERDTDSNGDGIPDWWYIDHGIDPTAESIALEDWDEDGINNHWEYRLGGDPNDAYSLWKIWVAAGGDRTDATMFRNDSQFDSDSDGLTNGEEINTHLTDPTLPDTDDDGLTDKEEVDRTLDPLDSLMPYIMRFVRNDSGIGQIEVPGNVRGKDDDGMRFNLNEWTIEATVRLAELPSVTGDPVVLVSRRCKPFGNLTFELGVGLNDRAYVRFHSEDASQFEYRLDSVALMETGKWVSVAGRLSHDALPERQQLDIFVDSYHDSRELSNAAVALGAQYGPLVMAQGLRGDIDEVRIWNVARSTDEIDRLRRRKLHFGEDVATMGVLNVNGGLLHRSFNQDVRLSTWTAETWFKSESAGMVMQRAAGTGDDGVDIYNYRINIKDDGYIEAEFAFNTLVLTSVGPRYRWATVTLNASSRRVDRGQWHFVSLSYDGRDAILYLDGIVEDRVTIDPAANLPALGLPYWHMLEGEESPPSSYLGEPAVMATQEGVFRAGEGMQGQLDEVRLFSVGSTQAQIDQRRFTKVTPTEAGLVLYYDFDDLDDLTAERVEDKANVEAGVADLLQGASLDSGSGVNAPIEFFPVQILAPKLAAYFPMDEGTYTRLNPPRGFDGHQVKDFLRKLDFDFAGTFSRSDVYFMYNDESRGGLKYTQYYLANTEDWINDTHFVIDADGDGMPDWWEVYYGLDPNRVATPDDARMGPYGDPDKDGLSNLAEFLARTDPFDRDTTRSGFGDYDSRPSAFEPTFGQRFDDGDRIADAWEVLYMYKTPATLNRSLDPVYYDAHLDPDEDRWSNYAEFMANSDPTDSVVFPQPLVRVSARYSGRYGDDITDVMAAGVTSTNTNDVVVITNVVDGVQLHLHFYDVPTRDGFTTATVMTGTAVTELREFDSGHLTEGMNYVFAFLDMNNDEEWDPEHEPAGIASFNLGWGDWNEVEIPLTDDRQMRGFPRLRWDPVPAEEQAVTLGYTVLAKQGPVDVFSTYIANPMRSYLHEGDYRAIGLDGLGGNGSDESFTFEVYKNNTVYGYDFETPHEILIAIVTNTVTESPAVVTGHDITFAYARNELAWTMDPNATWYQMTFRANGANDLVNLTGSALLQTGRAMVPFRDVNGHYTADLPFYAGDVRADGSVWTNGRYWVQITTGMELGGTRVSAWMPFNLGVREPDLNDGKSMIEGKLYYFGGHDFFSDAVRRPGAVSDRVPVVVQTFSNPGFSGVPDAQVTIDPTAWTNTEYRYEAVFQLKGLHRGSHYLRAFADSNENGKLDDWETWGFNRDVQTYYEPLRISLESEGVMRVQDQMVIIRDRDTDDDGLPDIWEYTNYGGTSGDDSFLTLYGGESAGANNLLLDARWQYGLDAFTAVAIVDANANGIPDEWEQYYFGRLLLPGEHTADPDGDGMSIYAEYFNGSDPLNPGDSLHLSAMQISSATPMLTWSGDVNYRVMYTDSLMASWTQDNNLANYSRTSIGGGAYTWTYTDPAPITGASRFYRVVIVPGAPGDPYP